jgi:hypothetical protein
MLGVTIASKMMGFARLEEPGESMGMAYKLSDVLLHDVVSCSDHWACYKFDQHMFEHRTGGSLLTAQCTLSRPTLTYTTRQNER